MKRVSKMTDALEKLRGGIREVDYQILKLVKQRLQLAKEIGEIKRKRGLPVVDSDVEKGVIERALTWSRELGLNQSVTIKLVELLITEAIRVQEDTSKDKA